jgi:hypothetical protein
MMLERWQSDLPTKQICNLTLQLKSNVDFHFTLILHFLAIFHGYSFLIPREFELENLRFLKKLRFFFVTFLARFSVRDSSVVRLVRGSFR